MSMFWQGSRLLCQRSIVVGSGGRQTEFSGRGSLLLNELAVIAPLAVINRRQAYFWIE
jgi:hypothetical protein